MKKLDLGLSKSEEIETKFKIFVKEGKVINVEQLPNSQISVFRYNVPKQDLIDKDPDGKLCSRQNWIRKSPKSKVPLIEINVFISSDKLMRVKPPKGIEVIVVEEK